MSNTDATEQPPYRIVAGLIQGSEEILKELLNRPGV